VDALTGDIDYTGNVEIKGNVRSGFRIVAKGDIVIHGVVEGATIISEGQIVIDAGIHGSNKAVIKAGSNLITKFIETATVEAGGFIQTDYIVHSNVSAYGDIVVNGRKGLILGGETRSTSLIHVKTAGNQMGAPTKLEVGVNPQMMEDYRNYEKEVTQLKQELDKNNLVLLSFKKQMEGGKPLPPDKLIYIKTTLGANRQMEERIAECQAEMNNIKGEIDSNENGAVKVIDTIYPGCKIVISGVIHFVRSDTQHCRYEKRDGDVVMSAY
jgi:uncharacterized protein (DUF342 family)